jgi:hypothetical protein
VNGSVLSMVEVIPRVSISRPISRNHSAFVIAATHQCAMQCDRARAAWLQNGQILQHA